MPVIKDDVFGAVCTAATYDIYRCHCWDGQDDIASTAGKIGKAGTASTVGIF